METLFGGNNQLMSFTYAMTSPKQGYRMHKMSFCIIVCVYRHNIPECALDNG